MAGAGAEGSMIRRMEMQIHSIDGYREHYALLTASKLIHNRCILKKLPMRASMIHMQSGEVVPMEFERCCSASR